MNNILNKVYVGKSDKGVQVDGTSMYEVLTTHNDEENIQKSAKLLKKKFLNRH